MAKETNDAPLQEQTPEVSEVATTSYEKVVKDLIANNGKAVKRVVKNINFEILDNYTRVSFTLRTPIKGYVPKSEDSDEFEMGERNVIGTSLYAITGMLKEKDDLAWMANIILNKPAIMNLVFTAAEVSVVAEEVRAGTNYANPFSSKKEITVMEHDTVIYHIIDIKLSPMGLKFADKLADNIMAV